MPRAHAVAVLGAMLQIALAHGTPEVTDADRATIDAAARIVLGLEPVPDAAPCSPAKLANLMLSEDDASQAVRMLAVMSLVDGRIDAGKTALVAEYARALRVDEAYLQVLAEAAQGEVAAATACMVRRNVASFPLIDPTGLDTDPVAPFLPYRDGHGDPELAARYAHLAHLPEGTFGRAFWEHFHRDGFAFPGEENGLAEGFTTPHDTSHVLSGYSTSQQGELCVSTFIGAMHPDPPMSAEVLPVLFSWHLDQAQRDRAQLDRRVRAAPVLDGVGPRRGDHRGRARPGLGLLGGDPGPVGRAAPRLRGAGRGPGAAGLSLRPAVRRRLLGHRERNASGFTTTSP